MQLEISDRLKNNILPTCLGLFDVIEEEMQGKEIIHIVVLSGLEKPYYLKWKGMSPVGCFLRVGSGVQQMTIGNDKQIVCFSYSLLFAQYCIAQIY